MLFQELEKRNFVMNRRLGSSLAMIAGAINVAGFMEFGYYCANMTGNASALALNLQKGALQEGLRALELGGSFVLGAVICTILVNIGHRQRWPAKYVFSILLEAGLLALMGLVNAIRGFDQASFFPAFTLAFLMGLQNATVTRISGSVVRTTHITGMMTDLGIEIADLLDSWRYNVSNEHRHSIKQRLWLHLQIIGSFVVGGVIGAFVYHDRPTYFFLITACLLAGSAILGSITNATAWFSRKN